MKRRNKDLEATIRDTARGLEAILDKVHSGELEADSVLGDIDPGEDVPVDLLDHI